MLQSIGIWGFSEEGQLTLCLASTARELQVVILEAPMCMDCCKHTGKTNGGLQCFNTHQTHHLYCNVGWCIPRRCNWGTPEIAR